jgi:hypothetical protein
MCSNSPKVRLRIDWDADGAFASVTRPGEAAEDIRLSNEDTVRIMKEAAEAWLWTREKMSVTPARGPRM